MLSDSLAHVYKPEPKNGTIKTQTVLLFGLTVCIMGDLFLGTR